MMLNYENFKEEVVKRFLSFLPEKYQGLELELRPVNKVNQKRDGLFIKNGIDGGGTPILYVDEMYENYLVTLELETVLKHAAEAIDISMRQKLQMPIINPAEAKERIILQLINTSKNEELLQKIPNRQFHDLSVIYRWVVSVDQDGIASSIIHNELAEVLNLNEEQIFKYALGNTRLLLPLRIYSAEDILKQCFGIQDISIELNDLNRKMWIISNARNTYGAGMLFYEDVLYELAQKLDSNLYILPSSIHEVIAVPADSFTPEKLATLVVEVNQEQVSVGDQLSNQVYYYDKDLRKLLPATDK